MIDQLKAVEAALAPLGYPTFRIYAVKPPVQYVVLSSPAWGASDETQLSGPVTDVDTALRVKAVAGTPDGVGIMLNRIRNVLSPGLEWQRIPMQGWRLETRFTRSEFIDIDPDTTNPATGLHPAWGVDTYHLVAQLI